MKFRMLLSAGLRPWLRSRRFTGDGPRQPELAGMRMRAGRSAFPQTPPTARRRVFLGRWCRKLGLTAAGGTLLAATAWLLLPRPDLLPPDLTWSRRVTDRQGGLLQVTLAEDGRYRLWTPLAELPPDLLRATLAHEDRRFYEHRGIDFRSVGRAVWGLVCGHPRGGGSTVTMQLARLRFRLETRDFTGKAVQMFRALQLERHYSKPQILEAYLNLVPGGGNVEGAGTASWVWLGRPPASLTFQECVALSLVPQRPARRSPGRAGPPDPSAAPLQRRLTVCLRGETTGLLTETPVYHLQAVPRGRRGGHPDSRAFPIPPAPHFARTVLRRSTASVVETTLDPTCQDLITEGIRNFLARHREEGVRNAAALLVHAPTREVRAWAGSAGFADVSIRGQVDGVTARRPPGSLLKPFIYGLAMQQGLIHPRSLVMDVPASFSGYHPENFDRGYAGPLPASEALYRSRNLPAVRLMARLRPPGFHGFLKTCGVRLPHQAGHYGLSLALGSQEITMEEAAVLYCLLADDGVPRSLKLIQNPEPAPALTAVPRLEAGPRFLVREMLRPPVPALREEAWTSGQPLVSWKSGTSHGWRDAWAAGIRGEYVLVVWVGDFQNRPNPAYTGRRTAGPLLFSLLEALDLPLPAAPAPPPPEVRQVSLCAVSGDLPGPCCLQQTQGWYLPGLSPVAGCRLHQRILVDAVTGLRVPAGQDRAPVREEIVEIWPPALEQAFRQAGTPRRAVPRQEMATAAPAPSGADRTECAGVPAARPASPFSHSALPSPAGNVMDPVIAFPRPGRTYTLRASDPARRHLSLQARTAAGVREIYWFCGSRFLGRTDASGTLAWAAPAGTSLLRVMDDQGRSASCQIRTEVIP